MRRKIFLPKAHLADYADPTEPNLYPEKYATLVRVNPEDVVLSKHEVAMLRLVLVENSDWDSVKQCLEILDKAKELS